MRFIYTRFACQVSLFLMGLWAEFKFNADFKVETETFHGSQNFTENLYSNCLSKFRVFQSFGVVAHFESGQ